jgi:hypothetical protein
MVILITVWTSDSRAYHNSFAKGSSTHNPAKGKAAPCQTALGSRDPADSNLGQLEAFMVKGTRSGVDVESSSHKFDVLGAQPPLPGFPPMMY